MNLTEQINADMKEAMKAREKEKLSTLRSIKSALMVEATKGGDSEISDEVGMQIITKLYKQRKESASVFNSQGREDLAQAEEAEWVKSWEWPLRKWLEKLMERLFLQW